MFGPLILVSYYTDPPLFTRKFVNNEYCSFFSVKPEQIIGQSCLETTPREHRERVCNKIMYCIENDAVLVSVEPTIKFNGSTSLIRWVDVPIKDKLGKIIEVLSIGSHVPDRRMREDRRQSRLTFGL